MRTAAEQVLREKAQAPLERMTLAKSRGEPLGLAVSRPRASLVAIGEARGRPLTVKRELEATRYQRGTLAAMRKALASTMRWR
jgi:hypothetical protein